nr:immunoglobulin light chain junction region [Macaca mulatta]MOV62153.1 immunoglobulin light chain junction region [Macaca mulatta]MOV62681.1 immunoglobulin light chain junction region [Macaca mulatta]MOV64258.1 immunoglobulin light chain junction region [Macaca mulatta]MOV64469.1 immunoglobulin light chain junction region [Macaca mulatta]
CQQGYDSPYNF